MKKIIECGGLPHIVFMLHSNHVVMLNEAIVSLTIMVSTFLQGYTEDQLQLHVAPKQQGQGENESSVLSDSHTVSSQLHTDAVINGIKNCLKNSDCPKEVKANAATLTITLLKTKREDSASVFIWQNSYIECIQEDCSLNP